MTSSPGSRIACAEVVEALLAAARHQDLVGRVVEAVVALELVDNGLFQTRRAIDRGVLGLALGDRLARGVLDMFRGVEIRLAGAQPDHVLAFGTKCGGTGGDGQCRGGFDGLYSAGKLDAHGFYDYALR